MLVLTRKPMERIQIGDNITITILRISGNSIRVGIDAPREVRVIRGELPRFEDANDEEAEELPSGKEFSRQPQALPLRQFMANRSINISDPSTTQVTSAVS